MEIEMQTREWFGFKRYDFEFEGHQAFIVEPEKPFGDGRWNWCLEWPEAFVERCGALELLKLGYYHVHVNIHGTYASPEGMKILDLFYRYLTEQRGFQKRAVLMGLSMGGLYSYRFAMEYPERVALIYGDAPVCDVALYPEYARDKVYQQYGFTSLEEALASDLNPVNHLDRLVNAGIPLITVLGAADDLVIPADHTDVLEKRYLALGGNITVFRRPGVGHHPHGHDDKEKIVDMIHQFAEKRLA